MRKKIISVFLAAMLCLSIVACGEKPTDKQQNSSQTQQESGDVNGQGENNNGSGTAQNGEDGSNSSNGGDSSPSQNSSSSSDSQSSSSSDTASTAPITQGSAADTPVISGDPSPENPKTEIDVIANAKNTADVVYKAYITSYIEGDARTLVSSLSAPAKYTMKDIYGTQYNKTAAEISDSLLVVYLLSDLSTNPEPGTLVYTVNCKVKQYFEKDSAGYVERYADYFIGYPDNVNAFAIVEFSVVSGDNTVSKDNALLVLVDDIWQVITTKINVF